MIRFGAGVCVAFVYAAVALADGKVGVKPLQFPLGETAWFDGMALIAKADANAPTPVFPYVIGDNLKGYYRGETGRARHTDGYRVGDAVLLAGVEAWFGGQRLRRERAEERVFPWGFLSTGGGQSLWFLLHSGRMALSLKLESETPTALVLQPLWASAAGECTAEAEALLIAPSAQQPWAMAIVADAPAAFSCGETPSVRTPSPAQQLSVHLLYAESVEAARRAARELPRSEVWAEQAGRRFARQAGAQLVSSDAEFNRALQWAQAATDVFHVQEFGHGLWAGLPWFRDNWGRDTFIALPGSFLVNGRFADARAILENFLRWQKTAPKTSPDLGRVPNRVAAGDAILYNTVDGTPWLFRSAQDYLAASGDLGFLKQLVPAMRRYLDGVRRHALDAEGFLTHDDADTWMDARIAGREAWSPRGNRAVEIQALWFETLNIAADWFARVGAAEEAARCHAEAAKLKAAFLRKFWNGRELADRLLADGRADPRLRPNALVALSIPRTELVPAPVAAQVLRGTVEGLMFPQGLASLSPEDPFFHPRHENPALHHKDAAYHNGTIWQWNSGPLISALLAHRQTDLAWTHSRELARQLLHAGTRGTLAELADVALDRNGEVKLSGTWAQSWSVAEFVRNAYQDYLGFRPDLLKGELVLQPELPSSWQRLSTRLPFSAGNALQLQMQNTPEGQDWQIHAEHTTDATLLFRWWGGAGEQTKRLQLRLPLSTHLQTLRVAGDRVWLNDQPMKPEILPPPTTLFREPLRARAPFRDAPGSLPVTREKDRLQKAILQTTPAEASAW